MVWDKGFRVEVFCSALGGICQIDMVLVTCQVVSIFNDIYILHSEEA